MGEQSQKERGISGNRNKNLRSSPHPPTHSRAAGLLPPAALLRKASRFLYSAVVSQVVLAPPGASDLVRCPLFLPSPSVIGDSGAVSRDISQHSASLASLLLQVAPSSLGKMPREGRDALLPLHGRIGFSGKRIDKSRRRKELLR